MKYQSCEWTPYALMPNQGERRAKGKVKMIRVVVRDFSDRETVLEVKGKVDSGSLDYLISNLRELVGGTAADGGGAVEELREETSFDKVKNVIGIYFKDGYFTTLQLMEVYREVYDEDVKLTTISTYLARLHQEGYLTRIRHGRRWIYELATKGEEEVDVVERD